LRDAVSTLESSKEREAAYAKTSRRTRDNAPAWIKELDKIAHDGKKYAINRGGSLEEVP
jgi:hypothetical protein